MNIKTYENKNIREKLYYKELASGLKVYFMPKEGYTKQYAIFATDYGSIDNIFVPVGEKENIQVPEGIAHFLEHKLFEEPEQNIFDRFSKLGANVNAYTNFTQTAYLFSSTDNFYENLALLVEFVQHPYFTDENVEKEKGIIAQEINMYKDNPNWRVFFNCLRGMYQDHPIKIDIAGTVESIQDINKDVLYQCYSTFYNPSNMTIFVVGDLSFDEILHVIEEKQRTDYGKAEHITRVFPNEPKEVKEKIIEETMMTSAPLFYIGFKDIEDGLSGKDRVRVGFMTNIILDMLFGSSSLFYNNNYEEGLIDSSFGAYYTGKKTYGHSLIVGESKNPKEIYNRVMDLFEKNGAMVLSEGDFNRMKKKAIGEFLMGLNSVEFIANNFISLCFEDVLLIDYLDIVDSIEYKDTLLRFEEHFTKENVVLSIINPSK